MNEIRLKKIFEEMGMSIYFEDILIDVPISYQKRYVFKKVTINLNLKYLFIQEKRTGSIETFVKQAEYLSEQTGLSYVLVFTSVINSVQTMLVKSGLPFIDYKRNLFIPNLGLRLNNSVENKKIVSFTNSEQLVLIMVLLNEKKDISIEALANSTNISIPSIYRILKRFIVEGWVYSEYGSYQLKISRIQIYKAAHNHFINPIKKKIYIDEKEFHNIKRYLENELMIAGTKALELYSMLVENSDVYAIQNNAFNKITKKQEFFFFHENVMNNVELQLWKYRPVSFKKKSVIDPISLLLTLKDETDPRVEQECEYLEKKIFNILEEFDNAS